MSACESLAEIARRGFSHLGRIGSKSLKRDRDRNMETVFIGHGHAKEWMELRDFIRDQLGLRCDEFNQVPVAGVTTIERLSAMLDGAVIAFLVLTAEDEMADGKLRARPNVIHEAGLFQGRLGFEKAIVMLEEGCEDFSNIHGLGDIRFPKNNIKAAFPAVQGVLAREGLISVQAENGGIA